MGENRREIGEKMERKRNGEEKKRENYLVGVDGPQN